VNEGVEAVGVRGTQLAERVHASRLYEQKGLLHLLQFCFRLLAPLALEEEAAGP
jgi:hypothetical protein